VTNEAVSPRAGDLVLVRQRRWLVERVATGGPGEGPRVALACVDDDAQGQGLEVLWELELDGEILGGESWNRVAELGFDAPRHFSAYWNTLRWNCVTATDPNLFQAPFRAGIRIEPYQLEPLRKALLLPRVNLFIADDVGLGKTIEAGLILRELLLRKRARELVVACPPAMVAQWQEELSQRFGLNFAVMDREYVQRARRERGFGVNPWTTHTRFLISHRLLGDEAYAGGLRDWLGQFRPGSVLVLDEAHHAAPASGQRYAVDTDITHAVRDLAPLFEHRLFLSATPHNGHSNSFSALLEILDRQRFVRGVPIAAKSLEAVMVRRLKQDLRGFVDGFPERVVEAVPIAATAAEAPELRLAAMLGEYAELRKARSGKIEEGLLLCNLQQRLLSSVEAFACTLRKHALKAEAQPGRRRAVKLDLLIGGVGAEDERAELSPEELAAKEEQQVEAALEVAREVELDAKERELLNAMQELAQRERGQPDQRVQALVAWLRENLCPRLGHAGAEWSERRVIIFTEYEDTLRYLREQLAMAIGESDPAEERLAVFQGHTPPEVRKQLRLAFNEKPALAPVRILLCTDAAREGLNLQAHCWDLFHFDLPWNPARLEQRNGRIDRKLQPQPKVFCRHFLYQHRLEDQVLEALVRKSETIRLELGSTGVVLDARVGKLLAGGIDRRRIGATVESIAALKPDGERESSAREELERAREREEALGKQMDRLRDLLAKSQRAAGVDRTALRAALSSALELGGAAALTPIQAPAGETPRYVVPALDRQAGGDASWAATLDSLREHRKEKQKLWEWRREAKLRPVVFEDPGVVTEEVVQLHLEQAIAQRLLARLVAQGFGEQGLSRACVLGYADAVPRVLLLGRLALYGPGAARLHEEMLAVGARWSEAGAPEAYAREAQEKSVALLETAMREAGGAPLRIAAAVVARLQRGAKETVAALLPHLAARGKAASQRAHEQLSQRGEAEARDMGRILAEQKTHLVKEMAAHDLDWQQRRLAFEIGFERGQREADRQAWERRLAQIEDEETSEPGRIRAQYQVQAERLEPVGLVWLWPQD